MQSAPSLRVVAALALACSLVGCERTLAMPTSIADAIDRAGLRLEPAWFADAPISRDTSIRETTDAIADGSFHGRITSAELVAVTGPGNPRLGWETADHPVAYAVQWTDASTVGLVLVSARTGEILFVTAY